MPLIVLVADFHQFATMKSDLTASLLSEVCSDVGVEPALQPLDGEVLQFSTAS